MQLDSSLKTSIRPSIPQAEVRSDMTAIERFQNETLRPILKLQHTLLLEVCRYHFAAKDDVFFRITKEERAMYIEKNLLKDTKIRNELRGLIIGLFTVEEYQCYVLHSSALNRRMIQMLKERVLDGFLK